VQQSDRADASTYRAEDTTVAT